MRNMANVVCRRRVEDDEGQQGCAIVLLSDDTIQYEFKNGKGKKPFYIPYDVVEEKVESLKAEIQCKT